MGIVVADGPSRVVRFCLIHKDISTSQALSNAAKRQAKRSESYLEAMGLSTPGSEPSVSELKENIEIKVLIAKGASETMKLKTSKKILIQSDAIRDATENTGVFVVGSSLSAIDHVNISYSVRISLPEVTICLIDQEPSEIAVISFLSINMLSKWDSLRINDAVITLSVGWVSQIIHCFQYAYKSYVSDIHLLFPLVTSRQLLPKCTFSSDIYA